MPASSNCCGFATLPHRANRVFAAGLAAAALCAGCKGASADSKQSASIASAEARADEAVTVRFAKIESRKIPRSLDASGTLDADERSEVASQTPGVVRKVAVDVGSRVKKGDVLVELDASDAALRAQSANASVQQSMARLGLRSSNDKVDIENLADVRIAREGRDLAKLELERTRQLFHKQAASQAALDQAESALERAQAQYDAALSGSHQAIAGLAAARAQANLASKGVIDSQIRAPFDGAVVEKRIAPGEFAGLGRVVAVVVRDNPLRLRFDVAETDLGGLAIGKPVELRVAAYPTRVFKGTVKLLGASVKAQSRTLPVEAEVPNDDGALKVGFFATARVVLEGEPVDARFVPKQAVDRRAATPRVYVRSGNRVLERLVTLGLEDGELVEVRGKIAPDAEVATTNVELLSDGTDVAAQP